MKKSKISGSVRPRPNADNINYYDIVLELGRDPLTGKRKRVHYHVDTYYETGGVPFWRDADAIR